MAKSIKDTLSAYNFTKVEIAKFMQFYNFATTNEYPYPELYALMKTLN